MKSVEDIRNILSGCIGTETYYRVFPGIDSVVFTDGVKVMAEECEAYWLINAIASYQCEEKIKDEPFQVWTLEMLEGRKAILKADDGNGNILATQEIPFTDFPLPEGIKIYLTNGTLLLPSEY